MPTLKLYYAAVRIKYTSATASMTDRLPVLMLRSFGLATCVYEIESSLKTNS